MNIDTPIIFDNNDIEVNKKEDKKEDKKENNANINNKFNFPKNKPNFPKNKSNFPRNTFPRNIASNNNNSFSFPNNVSFNNNNPFSFPNSTSNSGFNPFLVGPNKSSADQTWRNFVPNSNEKRENISYNTILYELNRHFDSLKDLKNLYEEINNVLKLKSSIENMYKNVRDEFNTLNEICNNEEKNIKEMMSIVQEDEIKMMITNIDEKKNELKAKADDLNELKNNLDKYDNTKENLFKKLLTTIDTLVCNL